jgi:hypothetical protein
MTNRFHHRLLTGVSGAVLLAVAMAGAVPAAASAPTTSTTSAPTSSVPTGGRPSASLCTGAEVAGVQQLVDSELADRVTQLNALTARVHTAPTLQPQDRAILMADLTQTELPGIQGLETTAHGATTCLALRQDAHAMVFRYRVYLVMTPQTDLVIANDAAIGAAGVLSNLEPVASAAIGRGRSHGIDVAAAQATLIDYQDDVTAARALTSGQSATVLAQTPADFPASRAVFLQTRTNLTSALGDLHAAHSDLAQIIDDLT